MIDEDMTISLVNTDSRNCQAIRKRKSRAKRAGLSFLEPEEVGRLVGYHHMKEG